MERKLLERATGVSGIALGQVPREDAEAEPREQLLPGSVTYSQSLQPLRTDFIICQVGTITTGQGCRA